MAAVTISEIDIRIQAATEQLRADLAKANKSLDRLRANSEKGARGRGVLAQAATDAKALLPKLGLVAAALAAVSAVNFGVRLAAEAEQTQVAFETMLGNAEAAKQLLGELSQFAAATPFPTDEVKAAAQQLLSFGVAADDVLTRLQTLGDIAAISSASIGELASIFGKMKSSGVVALGDLNQLGDRGIPIFETLKTQLGLTGAELRKFVSTGKLGFEDVLQALETMTSEGGIFFEGAKRASDTLAGSWSTLTSNIGELAKAFGSVLLPALTAVVKGLNKLIVGTLRLLGRGGAVDEGIEKTKQLKKELDGQAEATKKVAETTEELEAATKAANEERDKLRKAGQRVFEETRTAEEKAIARMEELRELLRAGAIDADTYARAVKGITSEFSEASEAARGVAALSGVSAATRRQGGFSAVQAARRSAREQLELAKRQEALAQERNQILQNILAEAERGGIQVTENRF